MTWVYVPKGQPSYRCLVEQEEESLQAGGCSDGEPVVTSKSTHTDSKSSRLELPMDSLTTPPSGMTLPSSTGDPGVDAWKLSALDFRASPTPLPESDSESMTSGTSGPIRSESFVRYDRESSGWRMSQGSFLQDISGEYSEIWPKQGTMLNGACFRRRRLAHRTEESESLFWRTPMAHEAGARIETLFCKDGSPARVGERAYRNTPSGKMVLQSQTLGQQVRYWPTPKSSRRGDCPSERKRISPTLESAVKMWPTPMSEVAYATPQARDYRTGQATRWDNPARSRNLNDQAVGKLSVIFVEYLMNWVEGWTGSKPVAMDKFRLQWLSPTLRSLRELLDTNR